jgi:hypothetical protein
MSNLRLLIKFNNILIGGLFKGPFGIDLPVLIMEHRLALFHSLIDNFF